MSTTRDRVDRAIGQGLKNALPELDRPDRDAVLTSDIGLDSVQIMNLVMEIEDELDISIPIDVLAEIRTLNQLAERLTRMIDENKT